ncbi:MAG: hypothetical protein E7376_00280 [Clostridiales bacterium]|nr:hypothetical protein [Clostridiales bacterium]
MMKSLIKEFSKDTNLNAFNHAYNVISQYIDEVINTIKQRNPYIINYELYVANEVFTGVEYFNSSLDLFLLVDAPQIELNFVNKRHSKFKNNLIQYWNYFKANFKLFSSRKKKGEQVIKQTNKKVLNLQDYDIEVLLYDLFSELTKLLYKESKLYIDTKKISIVGKEEFGVDINIYPVFITDTNSFCLYNTSTSKKIIIDFYERFDNIEIKDIKTQGYFKQQIKIFNNLYWNLFQQKPNQIFIESLLFDCPNELFAQDETITTINIINYLKNSTMQNKKSICNTNISLFKEPLNTIKYEMAIKFVNILKIQ